jgi:hypothetical protein
MQQPRQFKPTVIQTYEHTITGLLAKRMALFNGAIGIRNRLGEIKNDVAAAGKTRRTGR